MSCSAHCFLFWLPGDDFVFFLRVEDRYSHRGFLLLDVLDRPSILALVRLAFKMTHRSKQPHWSFSALEATLPRRWRRGGPRPGRGRHTNPSRPHQETRSSRTVRAGKWISRRYGCNSYVPMSISLPGTKVASTRTVW